MSLRLARLQITAALFVSHVRVQVQFLCVVFTRVRKISKSIYWVSYVYPSIRSYGTTLPSLDRFS